MVQSFLLLLQLGIGTAQTSDERSRELLLLSMQQWQKIMALAECQGVAAIAFDGVQRLFEAYPQEMMAVKDTPKEWMQWVLKYTGVMTQYEQRCLQQKGVIRKLSEIWASEGVRMMIFKGQANAAFYPISNHRATGDIDCWLFGEAERGDSIMKKYGALVDFKWYRHSKISFYGETIENHRVMSHTRGNKKHQQMEKEFCELAQQCRTEEGKCQKDMGDVYFPSAQFNACFLTYHGLHHFTSEGLRMKQVLDWAMFLEKEQDKVDWSAFNDFCLRYKLDRFAVVMNCIVMDYLGVKDNKKITSVFDNEKNQNSQKFLNSMTIKEMARKVLQSTLYDDDYLFNSGKSDWAVRWLLVKNMFTRDKWKYRDIAQINIRQQLWQNVSGFLFEKE